MEATYYMSRTIVPYHHTISNVWKPLIGVSVSGFHGQVRQLVIDYKTVRLSLSPVWYHTTIAVTVVSRSFIKREIGAATYTTVTRL